MPQPDVRPCPDCIIDSVGFGFVAGAVHGSAYHLLKGLYNSPNGRRLAAGAQAVRINAPRFGGRAAAYLGCAEAFECAMISARKKDDVWNYALPGFAAGICLSPGRGPRTVGISALMGLGCSVLEYAIRFFVGRVPVASSFPPPPVEDSGLTPPAGSPGKTLIHEVSVLDFGPSVSFRDWFPRKDERTAPGTSISSSDS